MLLICDRLRGCQLDWPVGGSERLGSGKEDPSMS